MGGLQTEDQLLSRRSVKSYVMFLWASNYYEIQIKTKVLEYKWSEKALPVQDEEETTRFSEECWDSLKVYSGIL